MISVYIFIIMKGSQPTVTKIKPYFTKFDAVFI